jgi:predicted transcriptional regulator
MESLYDTLYTAVADNPSPLSIRTLAKKTGIQNKRVRAVMREHEKCGKVVRVNPAKVGSLKSKQTIFCIPDNKYYC